MDSYDGYNYKKFKDLAQNSCLSKYEKIGFPDSYRAGREEAIFADIISKLPIVKQKKNLNILDIGSGCSDLQNYVNSLAQEREHKLFLSDSEEMLALVPDSACVIKVPGFFPSTAELIRSQAGGGVDVVLCYSVLQYIFVESNVWYFLDQVMELLNHGGQALIGDIPNNSKRRRFFASPTGVRFHKEFMKTDEAPVVNFNCVETGKIDDALLLSMVMHCHSSGCDAYVVPQPEGLPFANRRDDLLIRKP